MAKIVLKKMSYTSITHGIIVELDIPDDLVVFEVESQYSNTIDCADFKCYVGISRDFAWFERFYDDKGHNEDFVCDIDVIGDMLFFNLHNVLLKDIEECRIITREEAHVRFGLRDLVVVQWCANTHRFSSIHRIREYYSDSCIVADSIINHGYGEFVDDCMKTVVKNNTLYAGQISNHLRSSHITYVANINTNSYALDLYDSTLKYVCETLCGVKGVLPKYDVDMPYRTKRDVPTCGEITDDYVRMQVHSSECICLNKELPQNVKTT